MTTPTVPDPEWIGWVTGEPFTTLNVWDGTPSVFLAPTSRGAILWWQFDQGRDGSEYVLVTHVTDEEAQTVFETRTGDPLSMVRSQQLDNRAIIARRHPSSGSEIAYLFYLPRNFKEPQFADWLDEISDIMSSEPLVSATTDPQFRFWAAKPRVDVGWSRIKHEKVSPLDTLAATAILA